MIFRKPKAFAFLFFIVALSAAGCAHSYRFQDAQAVTQAGDDRPSPVPEKTDFDFVEYAVTSSVRYPLIDILDTRRKVRSQDVNSLDEVPASSWFTPRLGAVDISSQAIVKGPEEKGSPELPLTIVKAKKGGNSPGFVIQDARGLKYLIKFDRAEYPALESTVNFVANRLFWGFGYNVPEEFIFYFPSAESKDVILGKEIERDAVNKILTSSHAEKDGRYRAVASLLLEGKILGPIPQKGTRQGDPNDKIPHENRRTLRALRMFCAWLDNSGVRSDNTLDVYVGNPPDQGHAVHYLLDFGEALGLHGYEKERPWDGFEHFFSWKDMTRNFFTFGFPLKKWERLNVDATEPLGSFESEMFEAGKWKESLEFMPIRSSQPDDDYWAAKIIAAIKPEHLEALFQATNHPEKNYTDSLKEILLKRQEKILSYALSRVSPIEAVGLESEKLLLKDLGQEILGLPGAEYQVRFLKGHSNKAVSSAALQKNAKNIEVPIGEALSAANGYLIVEIRVIREGRSYPRAAQFHISGSSGSPKLVGVIH